MPICLNCSAAFEGFVCQKCGAPQHRPGPAPLTGKLMGPVAWLIAGILAAGVVLGALVIGVGISLVRRIPQGLEQSRRRNQDASLALARLLTSTHLELEVLSIDPGNSTVTLRHRHTGSIVTQDIESARKGNFLFGTAASTLPVSTPRQARPPFGIPEWIPAYPLAHPMTDTSEAGGGSFGFQTTDSVGEVISFYQEGLRRSGFQITAAGIRDGDHKSTEGALTATDPGTGRNVFVTISGEGSLAKVLVTYQAQRSAASTETNPRNP